MTRKLTVFLNDSTIVQAKTFAGMNERTVSSVVQESLQHYLSSRSQEMADTFKDLIEQK